jgi:hypothetical protein
MVNSLSQSADIEFHLKNHDDFIINYPSKINDCINELMKTTLPSALIPLANEISESTIELIKSLKKFNGNLSDYEKGLLTFYLMGSTLKYCTIQNEIVWNHLPSKIKKIFSQVVPFFLIPSIPPKKIPNCRFLTSPFPPGLIVFEDRMMRVGKHFQGLSEVRYELPDHPNYLLIYYEAISQDYLDTIPNALEQFPIKIEEIFDTKAIKKKDSTSSLNSSRFQYAHNLLIIKKTYAQMLLSSIGIPVSLPEEFGRRGSWTIMSKTQSQLSSLGDLSYHLTAEELEILAFKIQKFFLLEYEFGICIMGGGNLIPNLEKAESSYLIHFFTVSRNTLSSEFIAHNLPLFEVAFIDSPLKERYELIKRLFSQSVFIKIFDLIFNPTVDNLFQIPIPHYNLLPLGLKKSSFTVFLTGSLELKILCNRLLKIIKEEVYEPVFLESVLNLSLAVVKGIPIKCDKQVFKTTTEKIITQLEIDKQKLTSTLIFYLIQECTKPEKGGLKQCRKAEEERLTKLEILLDCSSKNSLYFIITKILNEKFKEDLTLQERFKNNKGEIFFDGATTTIGEYFSYVFLEDFHTMIQEVLSAEITIYEKIAFLRQVHTQAETLEHKNAVNCKLQEELHEYFRTKDKEKIVRKMEAILKANTF